MDKMWTFYLSAILLSVLKIQHCLAAGCDISSVTSPSASSLRVMWTEFPGSSHYLLDLRVVNSTSIAPVMVTQTAPSSERLIQGLRPGSDYLVKLKVFQFMTLMCTDEEMTLTVPATPQIISSTVLSSASIHLSWSSVSGADSYVLFVEKTFSAPAVKFNQTFTTLDAQVDGLTPSTVYSFYVMASNSAGRSTKSSTRTFTTLVQPPPGVSLVSTGKTTARVTWNPVTKVLRYQVSVTDNDLNNAPVIRTTSTTSMDIGNLEPCSNYTVGVSSLNAFLVPGEPSNVIHLTATINPVTNVSLDYSCSSGMVTVTWTLVYGANLYRAKAVDGTGASRNCTSSSNSCQITMLTCGEKYLVHVTAISDDCESTSNTSQTFETVPCAPAQTYTTHACTSNVITFGWEHTNNTRYYVAKSVDNNGQETECMTTDNKCPFTNTGCGRYYTYTVYAVSECNSELSQPGFIRTAPCLPTNIRTGGGCLSEVLIMTWDSAAGALSYSVEAEGNNGETYNCSSSNNSCALTGVECGQHLSVWIVASNDNCSTPRVLGEVAETVPCSPKNISATVHCSKDSARFNWTASIGALFYIAVAQDANGNSHSCNSWTGSCMIEGLSCGQNYTGSVIGTNLKCNSTSSQELSFMTAPCSPTIEQSYRDCEDNSAMIVWQNPQPTATGLYTATLGDRSGGQLSCSSGPTSNMCQVNSLPCGKRYNVTVSYSDGYCQSTSTSVSMDSVPCSPEDVTASVACVSGELTVAWNVSVPAENYRASIFRGMGQPLVCNSTGTQCAVQGLLCGSTYTVSVVSFSGACDSPPSSDVTVESLPCPPTNVTVEPTCVPAPVPVSWVASTNAKHYTAVATSSRGHRAECTTDQTSCSIPGLRCGELYSVGVSGASDNCTSQLSETVSLNTAPCSPVNVSSQLICSAGASHVFWAPSVNALNYTVEATGNGQTLLCTSTSPNCTLDNLVCGQAYSIVVTAGDSQCISNNSETFTQDQVPCAPRDVRTDLSCGTNDLTVSWNASAPALNYSAMAVPLVGGTGPVTCHTIGGTTSCVLSLQCGRTYNVSAKASSGSCCGPYSPPQTVHTAPCSPQNLTTETDCGANSMLASWTASPGATTYTATVTGPGGFSQTFSSSNLTCTVSDLRCASQYNVSVTSQHGGCSSSTSQAVMTTGPCDPVNVTSALLCGYDAATVSWEAAAGAVAYTVHAHTVHAQNDTYCRSSSTSCELDQLQCGKVYNLSVIAEGATCNSTGRAITTLMTAPCSPTLQNSTLICGTNTSTLSWMPMADATGYVVIAVSDNNKEASCSSSTNTCNITDLVCGETYTNTITALGSQCNGTAGSRTTFTTAPCPPVIVSTQYTCGNNVEFGWTDPAGRLSFLAQVEASGYQDSCQTTNTSCQFQNLPCGLDFNLTVRAQGEQCNSTPSASEYLETAPCAPQNLSSTLVCLNNSVLISWSGSPDAIGANVTATGQGGHTHQGRTGGTSYLLTDIHCGETYGVTVTSYSGTCMGNPSAVHSFTAALCPPGNVTVSAACEGSTVSWSNATGSNMYMATATSVDDGRNHTCSSNDSNACQFTDLHCGETYSVTVATMYRSCWSVQSSATELRTASCPPTNLAGQVSCGLNTLTLTWDQSASSGANYSLKTERVGGYPASVHTTLNTSHTLTGLLCGQRYAFSIAAQVGDCSSGYSSPIEKSTAPCQPTNLAARVDCGTNLGNFSWADSDGADFYTVEVTGEHGHVASCSSNSTSCTVTLHCGRSYSATLLASTDSCNSSRHADIHFDSAPCLLEDIVAELECGTNVMNVSWAQTAGSENYTAWAISTDGHRASCNSTSNSCSVLHLLCGKVYEVTVTSSSIHCGVIAGSDYRVNSAPCKPENTSVDQNCSSNVMTVRWNQSSTTQNYTVRAMSASGANSTVDTTVSSVSFLNLSCGQLYTFTVTGHSNVCMSQMSTPMDKHSAPCPPTSVSAELNCTTRGALVSWDNADAATGYSAQATSPDGHNSSCSSMGTSCHLHSLLCGRQYSVVVEAMHTGCPGPASSPQTFITEPCFPVNLTVHHNVSHARVAWSAAGGAGSYSVRAVTEQGSTVTCNTTTHTSCFLDGLQCGHIYNVTVTAQNQACAGVISETHRLIREPCPPTNVQASMTCGQFTATVSWDKSDLAVGYVAYFDGHYGSETSCVGTESDTQCVVSGMMCGMSYSVRVKALGQEYNSSDSAVVSLTSGPCHTNSIEAVMDCEARTALLSWQQSVGAISYVAELTAPSGLSTSYTTNNTNCEMSSLRCGQKYNVTLTVVGDTCNQTSRAAGYLTTEPCVPVNLTVHYNVSHARVAWSAAGGAGSYSVQAVTEQGSTVTCNTTTHTSCFLDGLQCGQIYNVTVMAKNQACNNTVASETVRHMTEPCLPNNVQASMACEQNTATASWEMSDLAVGYVAYFNDHYSQDTCVATGSDTHCDVSGLNCGTSYRVWVKALGQKYNSSDSTAVSLASAPCLPSEVEVDVDCSSDGAAVVSWSSTYGVANFSLTAVVGGGLQTLCETQQDSCNVTGLSCGETYNLTLTASNTQCSLPAPTHTNLTTRPCPPERVGVDLQCGSRNVVLSWEDRSSDEVYVVSSVKASGEEVQKCNSTGDTCQSPTLECGEMYNFTVRAKRQGCSSRASSPVSIQTEPCQPVIVSAQASCQSGNVQISWSPARGVVNYLVRAEGSLGSVEIYNLTQTVVSPALPCGQHYNVTVRGEGSRCYSTPSSPAFFTTTPCVPRDVTTVTQCGSDTGSVSWGPSDGAHSYVAVATGRDGNAHQCLSNSTSCTWADLHCGEEYTVTVSAKDGANCTSQPSNSSSIYMGPCVPQNVAATIGCDTQVVSLSWDAANETESYTVWAQATNGSVNLNINGTSASFSHFACGQDYNFTVTPRSQHCPASSSATASVRTWPCPPEAVSTTQDCLSGIVTVSWAATNGSDDYQATMQTDSGITELCMSDSDGCSVAYLPCGYNYSVSVSAIGQQCNATTSSTHLQSVPCAPTNVSVVMGCANNSAQVWWSASRGAVRYSVTARSAHNNVSCQSTGLGCRLDQLACGARYNVTVAAEDDTCSSIPSLTQTFDSASCPPQNVSADVSCSTNDLAISWDAVRGADHFLVTVTANNGGGASESCNTTNTACSISNVTCGNTFTVQVTSVTGTCSQHSPSHSVVSAPCQPQGISQAMDCVTNSAWISWDPAEGADSYLVSAEGLGGEQYAANCTATSANTTCPVEDLACGVLYNFSVTAKNSQCESKPSDTVNLQTAPCSLGGITAVAQCHNSSILVMWSGMDGSQGNTVYTATAEASDRTLLSCNGTGTSCYLHGAQCDFHYTVIVSTSSDQCNSMRSPPYRISMEPCPPRDLVANTSCGDLSALVSWSPSPVAETYHVVATAVDGYVHACNATSTNCSLAGLHCDKRYTVSVTASHENCTSVASENATLYTGPCQPDGLSVTYNCSDRSAWVSWTPRDNAVDYYGCARAANGDMLYCHSSSPTCTFHGLDCGVAYNVSVQASDGTCNSSYSEPEQSGAAPCPPDTVDVQLMPVRSEVQVLRFEWTGVPCNDTEYLVELTGDLLGDNGTQFEVSSYWTSRTYFEIPLPCGSEYVATVKSRSVASVSNPSAALTGTTAPCPPANVMNSRNSSVDTVSWHASVFATSYTVYGGSVAPSNRLCNTTGLSCSLHNINSSHLLVTAGNTAGESEPTRIATVYDGRRRRDLSHRKSEDGGLIAPILDVKQASSVVVLEWNKVDAASHYNLVIRKQGSSDEVQELTVYGEVMFLTDLNPGSTYCFTVSPTNSATSGPESEPLCVQTGMGHSH